jgi:hypothetical protein
MWKPRRLTTLRAITASNRDSFSLTFTLLVGRAIAQAVSHWLPTAAARVRARVWPCGICGGQSGAEAGFLRVLRFPLPIFIPPIAPQSPSSVIWGLYNRPEVAAVPSGLNPSPLIIKKKWHLLHNAIETFSLLSPDSALCSYWNWLPSEGSIIPPRQQSSIQPPPLKIYNYGR